MAHHTQVRSLEDAHKQIAARQLSVWDTFAAAALQGLVGGDGLDIFGHVAEVAAKAASIADAMVIERNKRARIASGGNP